MPTGMNIVAAQRQYRWPQANIVFADRQKYRSPNSPPQKTNQALGNNLPMPAKVRQNLYPAPPFMPTGMNIIAAQRQYRWPQAKISFSKFPPQKTKQALGNNLPMPAKVRQNLYPAPRSCPPGMNIVAAQRQYRWPQAKISFSKFPLPKYKAGIGKNTSQCPQKFIRTYTSPPRSRCAHSHSPQPLPCSSRSRSTGRSAHSCRRW